MYRIHVVVIYLLTVPKLVSMANTVLDSAGWLVLVSVALHCNEHIPVSAQRIVCDEAPVCSNVVGGAISTYPCKCGVTTAAVMQCSTGQLCTASTDSNGACQAGCRSTHEFIELCMIIFQHLLGQSFPGSFWEGLGRFGKRLESFARLRCKPGISLTGFVACLQSLLLCGWILNASLQC